MHNIARSNVKLAIVVVGVAALGTISLLLSSAASVSLATATSPNDVIVQYSLPHVPMPVSTTNIQVPMIAPFTLYGNGLLVCGHDNSTPFTSGMSMSDMTSGNYSLPTSTTLSPDQINTLLQKIYQTGYFNLNHEYYKAPVIEEQDILRISLNSGDHYVLYYNDVPAPKAYTRTITILKNYCQKATAPYQSASVTLRTLKNANPGSQPVQSSSALASAVSSTLKSAFSSAGSAVSAATAAPQNISTTVTTPHEADQTLTGTTAITVFAQLKNTPREYVNSAGATYEVGMDVNPPQVSNPLNINYAAIRANEASGGLSAAVHRLFDPTAYAATPTDIPVRIVVLEPSDDSSVNTNSVAQAQALGSAVQSWYCGQVGACYNYLGVSTIRGSQTQAFYMTCHGSDPCQGNPLESVIYNVYEQDQGTIYRTDVDTEVVTGWPTGEFSVGVCGYGFVGFNLAAVDLSEPNISSGQGTFCQPGHDMAHELGHTFGLNHTDNGTLMDGSPYAQYASFCDIDNSLEPTCRLDSGQAAILKGEAQFFPPAPAPPPVTGTAIIHVVDANNNPLSDVQVGFDNTSSTSRCEDQWNDTNHEYATSDDGEAGVFCYIDNGVSGTFVIRSISLAGYTVSPSSHFQVGSQVTIPGGATKDYDADQSIVLDGSPPPPPPPSPIQLTVNGAGTASIVVPHGTTSVNLQLSSLTPADSCNLAVGPNLSVNPTNYNCAGGATYNTTISIPAGEYGINMQASETSGATTVSSNKIFVDVNH